MSKRMPKRELPAWALPVVLLAGLFMLLVLSWKALTGGDEPVGPPKIVHAGQYDIRAEIRKMRAAETAQSNR